MTNSKQKGSSFERTIANMLSKNLNGLNFQRVLTSGAFLGGKNSSRSELYLASIQTSLIGDVYCTNHENFKFTIETKSYKTPITFEKLLDDKCIIYQWFEEAVSDCKKNNKKPLLIFKFNRVPIHFCMYSEDVPSSINGMIFKNKTVGLFSDLLKLDTNFFLES